MSTYLVGDPHLAHELAAKERGFSSVEEHDETIICNWNGRITKPSRDVVIVFGDVCFRTATSLHLLERLLGIKHLLLGNHEHHDMSRYIPYFNKIMGMMTYGNRYVFTHIPIHPSQMETRFKDMVNVHGHVHNNEPDLFIHDTRYFNINLEFHNYTPVLLDDLDEMVKRKKEGWYSEYGDKYCCRW